MLKLIKGFFYDFSRLTNDIATIARCISANRPQDVTVHPSAELIDLLSNWRRRRKVQ